MDSPFQGMTVALVASLTIGIPLILFFFLVREEKKHQSQNKDDH